MAAHTRAPSRSDRSVPKTHGLRVETVKVIKIHCKCDFSRERKLNLQILVISCSSFDSFRIFGMWASLVHPSLAHHLSVTGRERLRLSSGMGLPYFMGLFFEPIFWAYFLREQSCRKSELSSLSVPSDLWRSPRWTVCPRSLHHQRCLDWPPTTPGQTPFRAMPGCECVHEAGIERWIALTLQ